MPYDLGLKYQLFLDVVEEANFKGELYYVFYEFTNIPVGGVVDFVVKTGNKNLFIAGREFTTTTDRMDMTSYVGPVYSGGTNLPVSPYNSIDPVIPALTTGVINPTVTSTGTVFDRFMFLGDSSSNPNNVSGSLTKNNILRMISTNSEFLLRLENKGSVPMDGIVKYLFFERDPSIPLK